MSYSPLPSDEFVRYVRTSDTDGEVNGVRHTGGL